MKKENLGVVERLAVSHGVIQRFDAVLCAQ